MCIRISNLRVYQHNVHPNTFTNRTSLKPLTHTKQKLRDDERPVSRRTQSSIYGTEHREHQNTENLLPTEERVKSSKAVAIRAREEQ